MKGKSYSLTFRESSFPLLQERSIQSLPYELYRIIQTLSIDPRATAKIVGSFRYIVHEYPADIDLFVDYTGGAYEETKGLFVQHIQQVARWIEDTDHILLGDFKAGEDSRYVINYGTMEQGRMIDYDPDSIQRQIQDLYKKGLLTAQEVRLWRSSVKKNPSYSEYKHMTECFRSKSVLRWNLDELLEGKKELYKGVTVTLEEALSSKHVTKIDLWVFMNGHYIEITAWFNVAFMNGNVKEYLTEKPMKYRDSIRKDITQFSNPKLHKQMKLAKRIWLYAILHKKHDLLLTIYPLFSSGSAKLYQVTSEMELMMSLLEKYKRSPIENIFRTIEDWKMRIGTIPYNILPADVSFEAFKKMDDCMKITSRTALRNHIQSIYEKLYDLNNRYVSRWLRKNRAIPT